jgi:hypothetical protein
MTFEMLCFITASVALLITIILISLFTYRYFSERSKNAKLNIKLAEDKIDGEIDSASLTDVINAANKTFGRNGSGDGDKH